MHRELAALGLEALNWLSESAKAMGGSSE